MSEQSAQEHWLRRGVRAVVRFIVRLVLLVLLFALVAAVLYYGIPWWYRTYVQPLYELQSRVLILEERLQRQQQGWQATQDALQKALAQLQEGQQEQQDRMAQFLERLENLEQKLAAQEALLQQLNEVTAALQEEQESLAGYLTALDLALSELEVSAEANWEVGRQVQQEMLVLRALLHVMRAQTFLEQENYLAVQGELDVLLDLLYTRMALLPEDQLQAWQPVVDRLLQAQEALPQRPVRAQQALDAAWNLLITMEDGLTPGEEAIPRTPTLVPTPTPEATPAPTPTPTPTAPPEG